MDSINIRRINCAQSDGAAQLAALRGQLGLQAQVVSPRGRQLTQAVFGEPLPPSRVVERICTDVHERGVQALFHYTEQLDGVRLDAGTLRISPRELQEAHAAAEPAFWRYCAASGRTSCPFSLGSCTVMPC
jgi:histidinol dehydrogenase